MTSIKHGPDAQPSEPQGDAPVVRTPAGAVRGVMLGHDQAAYLGIPFAEAPIGPLRHAAPVKRAPWEGVRDASRYGATPLRSYMMGATLIPEPAFPGDDTLLLNVFTPKPGDTSAKLPVYVWIHGGGFFSGSPSSSWYDGGAFPRDGVVVVSVSYRLGFDGFGVVDGAPDNRAVRDWILALEWVQESIAAFGGDPSRVTIGGQSAGGTAVLTLLSAPSAQDLFTAVIAESPGAFSGDRAAAATRVAVLAEQLGIAPTREAFASLPEETVIRAQMRMDKKALGLPTIRSLTRDGDSLAGWGPVVDGDLLPYTREDAIARGIGADKPLLIGATANEFEMIAETLPGFLDWLTRRATLRLAGIRRADSASYAAATPGKPRRLFGTLLTDFLFRIPLVRVLEARDRSAGKHPTYVYDFRMPSAANGLAGHCIELPFAWDCVDGENVPAATGPNPPQSLADLTHGAWTAFIHDGDPGWPAHSLADAQGMVLDHISGVAPVFTRESALRAELR